MFRTHQLISDDYDKAKKLHPRLIGWVIPTLKTCHASTFVVEKSDHSIVYVSRIRSKPVYYETIYGTWRPLSEIATHAGNKIMKLKPDAMRVMSPRYLRWLMKRVTDFPEGTAYVVFDYGAALSGGLQPHQLQFATTTEFIPDDDGAGGATTFDGYHYYDVPGWDNTHDATTSGVFNNDSSNLVEGFVSTRANGDERIDRIELLFDTGSVIGATESIDAASLTITGNQIFWNNTSATGSVVQLVAGSRAGTDTAINGADYDLVGDAVNNPTTGNDSGDRFTYANATSGTEDTCTFNATGRGWIARASEAEPTGGTAGISYLGIRETNDITDNNVLDGQPNNYGTAPQWHSAETATSGYEPTLSVTHTAAATFTPRIMMFV